MGFPVSTKPAHMDASEYHPDHSHVERGGSRTHPLGPPAASCQHTVLKELWNYVKSDLEIWVEKQCAKDIFPIRLSKSFYREVPNVILYVGMDETLIA